MSKLMTENHKRLLRRHRPDLTGHMDNFMIIEHLRSEEFLSRHDKENIEAKDTPTDQNGVLLDNICRKPDACYYALIKSLIDCQQLHLAGLLLQEGKAT